VAPSDGSSAGRGRAALIAGVAICSASLASCVAAPPPRSPAQTAADTAVANNVYMTLNADPNYFFRHVNVSVDQGVADLSGYVWTTDAIYRARRIARGVPGVTRVVTNHLELERNGLNRGAAR
jgi:osmotically-inducible protein OsmY